MKLYRFTSSPWNGINLYRNVMWLTENNPVIYLKELLNVNDRDIEKMESRISEMKTKSKRIEEHLKELSR